MLAACGKSEKHTIEILIPAGSTADFVYSDTEICPTGNKITISSGAGLGDTEVILKPVEVKKKTAYSPEYLTHGVPVKMDVEKGGWFKIGVSVQNDSDRGPIAVSVEVEGVEVRIAEKKDVIFNATVLEIHDGYYLVNPVEGSRELSSADKIEVSMKNLDSSLEPEVGDVIEITYDGVILEVYPARLHEVYNVRVVKEAENTDGAPLAPADPDLDLESVSHLEVMSGLTGQKITIKDADSVQKVMDDIESLRYEKKNAVEEVGYTYRIRFYNENYDELGRVFITEENGHQISYDGYYYLVEADQNINVDYLEELLKDAPPAEPGDDGNDEIIDIGPKKPENNEICGYPTAEDMGADKYGITLILENLTSTGATIKCEQSGGEVTGELETGSWYIVEKWTQMDGWKEVETVIDKQQVGWTSEAYMILADSTSEWNVNWEWLYGELSAGKYRIGKQITDWRAPGDYDTVVYHVPFEIN